MPSRKGGRSAPKKTVKHTRKPSAEARMRFLCTAAIIAALYVALTFLAMALGLDKNAIQIRFSESLIVLAYVTPAAVPGLYLGCLLANLLTWCAPLDILLGPVATLIGALGANLMGKMKNRPWSRFLCTVPNILANTAIVSFVCLVCYTAPEAQDGYTLGFYALTVGAGEIVSCGVLGTLLLLGAGKTIWRAVNRNT
jgi:uncharacterized membrane protein